MAAKFLLGEGLCKGFSLSVVRKEPLLVTLLPLPFSHIYFAISEFHRKPQ